jgi:hypothetical protein
MAVLAEAISVIVRKDAVAARLPGGEARFLELVPNRTLCDDQDLYRVGFLSPEETARFTDALQDAGLIFLGDNTCAVDLAVVDQQHGPTTACAWLGFGRHGLGAGQSVSLCWQKSPTGEPDTPATALAHDALATPTGWRYASSLSRQFAFTPAER